MISLPPEPDSDNPFDPKFRRSSYEPQPQREDIMFVEVQEPSSSRWRCPCSYEAWGDSRSSYQGPSPSGGAQPAHHTVFLQLPPPVSTMDPNPQKHRDRRLVECRHQGRGSRKGNFECDTGHRCFWFRRCCSDDTRRSVQNPRPRPPQQLDVSLMNPLQSAPSWPAC